MSRWWVYIQERFPIPVYALLVLGYTFSDGLLFPPITAFAATMTAIGLTLFFFLLRLMDEYKDHEKDKIVHPDRPIPRGLFTPEEIRKAILVLEWIMIAYSVLLGVLFSWQAFACYLWISLHLWGMYKEFYVGHRLSDFPLFYAITHQAVLIPIAWLGVYAVHPDQQLNREMIAYAALSLGSFFSYEVCRKLDPESHKLNKTYLQFYGPTLTALIVLVLISMSVWGAMGLGLSPWIFGIQAVFAHTLLIPVFAPHKYKITEIASTLSLVAHIWIVTIERMIK